MRGRLCRLALAVSTAGVAMGQAGAPTPTSEPPGRTFFVRQTGDDRNDGSSPETAWRSISRLSGVLEAGDTAYVGPGLYRDQIVVRHSGTPERRIRILADPAGVYTHDRPGVVMVTGAEPVDERIFEPHGAPGVFEARFPEFVPIGVVEMDGPQSRYMRARSTREHLVEGLSELEVVAARPSTYFHAAAAGILYLHTSDGAPPKDHELELVRRGAGITVAGRDFVTISGFTIRHTGDAGILFSDGSRYSIAIDNVSYGHRIGIRVNGATDVLVSGNVLFRNENSGVYFLRKAIRGQVLANVLYENVKGARFGSRSDHGRAIGNAAFRNHEAGISVEDSVGIQVMGNRMVRNRETQLFLLKSRNHQSESNCFEAAPPEQLTARLDHDQYADLATFQKAAAQDLGSRSGDCGSLPATVDVRELHRESLRRETSMSESPAARFESSDVLRLFPTFVWKAQLAPEVHRPIDQAILGKLPELLPAVGAPPGVLWQSGHGLHQLDAFAGLVRAIGAAVARVAEFLELGRVAYEITGCWANVGPPGAWHRMHSHPNNFLSGVYYVQVQEGADTINFHDPRPQTGILRPPVTALTAYNTDQVVVKVAAGTLLLFPAWLPHSVDANASGANRISASFNVMFGDFAGTLAKPLWGEP